MRNNDDERVPYRRPPVKKYYLWPVLHICPTYCYQTVLFNFFFSNFGRPANKAAGMESRDGDLDLDEFSR